MRFVKRITERGNITLPSEVREALDVQEGDLLEFELIKIVKKASLATHDAPGGGK